MEFLHKGAVRRYLSIIAIILVCVVRPVAGMQSIAGDVTDLYIIPVASQSKEEKVSERTWEILLTLDQGCCGVPQWKILHIPVKKLFYFNIIRGWFGDFTLDQQRVYERAYQALALLTRDIMNENITLYHSLTQGLDATARQNLKTNKAVKPFFSEQAGKAQYFFIPVEYIPNATLNPPKWWSRKYTKRWSNPDNAAAAASSNEVTEIEINTATILATYWEKKIKPFIIGSITALEKANSAYRLARIIGMKSPKELWDELKNTQEIRTGSALDPSTGDFKVKDKPYTSPLDYYKKEVALCKQGDSDQKLFECHERAIFNANFYRFKQADSSVIKQLTDTGNKILIYSSIGDALIGTGANYRGLNSQGRILMFLRLPQNINQYVDDEKGAESAYTAYKAANTIDSLFAPHNLRSGIARTFVKFRAGKWFGDKR